MIPIRDNVPRVHPPLAVVAVIVLNGLAFLYTLALPPRELFAFFHLFGVVPARFLHPGWATFAGYPHSFGLPFVSYMFLHGGWLHVIFNMWMLWIFGDNIEDVTGHGGFLVFYLLCGLAAVGMHMAFAPDSRMPIIGASGAIAGVMGAYVVLYPHGRVLTLVPVLFIPLFFRFPSYIYLGVWFAVQVFSGLAARSGPTQSVAWWAHVGGFLAGMLLIRVFRRPGRCRYCYNPDTRDYDPEDRPDNRS